MRQYLRAVASFGLVLFPGSAWADSLILSVRDWDQPSAYGVGGYPNWCGPSAGRNLMGYWEDVMGKTGLTDRQAFPAGPA